MWFDYGCIVTLYQENTIWQYTFLLFYTSSSLKEEKRYLAKKNPTDISNAVFCMFSAQSHLEWDDISKWKKNKIEHFPVHG